MGASKGQATSIYISVPLDLISSDRVPFSSKTTTNGRILYVKIHILHLGGLMVWFWRFDRARPGPAALCIYWEAGQSGKRCRRKSRSTRQIPHPSIAASMTSGHRDIRGCIFLSATIAMLMRLMSILIHDGRRHESALSKLCHETQNKTAGITKYEILVLDKENLSLRLSNHVLSG